MATTTKKTTKKGTTRKPTSKKANSTGKKTSATRRAKSKADPGAEAIGVSPPIVETVVQRTPTTVIEAMHVSDDDRRRMVAEAAYFMAEKRGFEGGDPLHDWLNAEAEIGGNLKTQRPHA